MTSSPPTSLLGRMAAAIVRRRAVAVGVWVAALVAVIAFAPKLAGEWSANYATPGSDSHAAEELLDARFPERSVNTLDVVWRTRQASPRPPPTPAWTACSPRSSASTASVTA